MAQLIIVYIILATALIFTVFSIIKSLKKKEKSPCDGCGGCELKSQMSKQKNTYKNSSPECYHS